MSDSNSPISIEVCADSVASAVAAERGGASRIELCSSLIEGGVTPSAGLIEVTRSAVSLPLHVMIRPRAGDFVYDEPEIKTMQRDIAVAKTLGANGVVLGILDAHGNVDTERTRELIDYARPLSVTFHRAFDMTADLFRALENICSTGADRILTSGGEQTSLEGCDTIAQLVQRSAERIVIMPGSGIKPENARVLVSLTGAKEIHVGLRTAISSPMLYCNSRISMGSAANREYERLVVLEENVRKLRLALQSQ